MKLKTFKRGTHPPEFKNFTSEKPIEDSPLPEEIFISLTQHIGAPCEPTVEKGDEVKTGELIGKGEGFVTSRVHSSISGTVKDISKYQSPTGTKTKMVHIEGDGEDEHIDDWDEEDWQKLDSEELINRIEHAGIVGLGGAAFPTNVKLSPPDDKPIDTFIVNGCECEPYLTADHRIMLEYAEELIQGINIISKILDIDRTIIGIEENKLDAIEKLKQATQDKNIEVIPLNVKYPQGAEKMLIKATLDREVPEGGLPMDVGTVVNNVGTIVSVYEAVSKRKPIIERVVSVTGQGITNPKNIMARIGTPFRKLIEYCDGLEHDTVKVLNGGPMMGIAQYDMDVPVIKGTSGILALTEDITRDASEFNCINCGKCVNKCPMGLVPTRIAKAVDNEQIPMAEEYGALSCIECGSCAFGCPSNIPLVQKIRIGKKLINDKNE